MNGTSRNRQLASIICLALGIALTVIALFIDFAGIKAWYRGPMFVVGVIGVVYGLYKFPTLKHHRTIINILFLFPLLFAFIITVILPLCLGLFYSFTDWNGIEFTKVIGIENYTKMFKEREFIWSILITFLFVVFNMILEIIVFLTLTTVSNNIYIRTIFIIYIIINIFF